MSSSDDSSADEDEDDLVFFNPTPENLINVMTEVT